MAFAYWQNPLCHGVGWGMSVTPQGDQTIIYKKSFFNSQFNYIQKHIMYEEIYQKEEKNCSIVM